MSDPGRTFRVNTAARAANHTLGDKADVRRRCLHFSPFLAKKEATTRRHCVPAKHRRRELCPSGIHIGIDSVVLSFYHSHPRRGGKNVFFESPEFEMLRPYCAVLFRVQWCLIPEQQSTTKPYFLT